MWFTFALVVSAWLLPQSVFKGEMIHLHVVSLFKCVRRCVACPQLTTRSSFCFQGPLRLKWQPSKCPKKKCEEILLRSRPPHPPPAFRVKKFYLCVTNLFPRNSQEALSDFLLAPFCASALRQLGSCPEILLQDFLHRHCLRSHRNRTWKAIHIFLLFHLPTRPAKLSLGILFNLPFQSLCISVACPKA